jgi:uncharacterized protein (TIGR02444 family)
VISAQGSPFWQFSLGFYGRPGVAEACVALQDTCDVDVNLLLFMIWLGLNGRQLSAAELRTIEEKSRGWARVVVAPLRRVRRALKGGAALVADDAVEPFRAKIKAIELEAERLEQEALYHLAENPSLGSNLGQGGSSVADAAYANIWTYEQRLGQTFTKSAVDVVLGAVREICAER